MLFWKKFAIKKSWFNAYNVTAFVIIALAAALRLVLVALGWPPLDSDEGTMGVMGMHIAFHGEHPIFFYGQGYMGAFEAYLAALMFRLFGVSTFTLLLGLILMYTLFLTVIYRLTCLLYNRALALITLIFLALGSNPMLTRELVAIGGYPETLMFGAIIMLLASRLALQASTDIAPAEQRKRLGLYGLWGFVAGLGIWTHLLIVPFVFMGGILLLLFCWRELLKGGAAVCLILALLLGALPMIVYNVKAPPGRDTLSYILHVHNASGIALPPRHILYAMQIKGALLVSLPLATGVTPLCSPSAISLLNLSSAHVILCTFVYAGWSLGIIVLWAVAVVFTFWELWLVWFKRHALTAEDRRVLILATTRLALLATAALTVLLYIISPDAALFPVATSRYLIGILVATPAILWPLWNGAASVKPLVLNLFARHEIPGQLSRVSFVVRRVVLVGIGLVLLIGTQSIFTGIPAAPPVDQRWGRFSTQVNDQHLDLADTRALNRQQYDLIDNLLRIGAVHIYSDYWTCDRLIFQSRERIICGSVKDNLRTGQDRYLPYLRILRADSSASYVFPIGSPQAQLFAEIIRSNRGRYRRFVFDDYIVYQPTKTTVKTLLPASRDSGYVLVRRKTHATHTSNAQDGQKRL